MKIALLNDSHVGARNSSDVFLDYFARFYSEVFFPYCDKEGIKQIIHLGDFYDHRKYINFKALNHSRKTFLEPMRDRGMIMDIIPGNHDVVYKNTNELCSLKELLGFFVNNIHIVMQPQVQTYDGFKIALLPWINPENYAESMKFVETCGASVLGAHLELAGFEVMPGMPAQHGMSPNDFKRFEMVLTGHYHTKSQIDNIIYLGTQYEMTWSDCEDNKFFHIFDTDTRELTAVRNPITIFSKIRYDDTQSSTSDGIDVTQYKGQFVKVIVKTKKDLFKFDRFIDELQKAGVLEIKIAETFDEFSGARVDDINVETVSETGDLLNAYVDSVETDLNKEVIKSKLRGLYVEASNLEVV